MKPRTSFTENLFAIFKNDIRGTWKTINDILCECKKKKSFPGYFRDEDNNIITNKTQISNNFNTFFTNVIPNLANKIRPPTNKHVENYSSKNIMIVLDFKILMKRL